MTKPRAYAYQNEAFIRWLELAVPQDDPMKDALINYLLKEGIAPTIDDRTWWQRHAPLWAGGRQKPSPKLHSFTARDFTTTSPIRVGDVVRIDACLPHTVKDRVMHVDQNSFTLESGGCYHLSEVTKAS